MWLGKKAYRSISQTIPLKYDSRFSDILTSRLISGALQGGVWKEQGERFQRGGRHSGDAESEEDARPDQ